MRGFLQTQPLSRLVPPGEIRDIFKEREREYRTFFDSLVNGYSRSRVAEFAAVELGDKEIAVRTHAIMMNRNAVEY
jgi:hypothetical protein